MLSHMQTSESVPSSLPAFLTVAQVQDLLQIGRGSVYRAIDLYFDSGGTEGIPAVRIGRLLRVPSEALISQISGAPPTDEAPLPSDVDAPPSPQGVTR